MRTPAPAPPAAGIRRSPQLCRRLAVIPFISACYILTNHIRLSPFLFAHGQPNAAIIIDG